MYIILGWVGWIWLGIVMILLPASLWVQHLRRRNAGGRGSVRADYEVTGKNEKQS
jgi:hypothetical protein